MTLTLYRADGTPKTTAPSSLSVPIDTWHIVGGLGEPAFSTGFDAYGSGTQVPGFRKNPFGEVEFRGLVRSLGTHALLDPLFTLPVGYRPPGLVILDASHNNNSSLDLRVDTTGKVYYNGAAVALAGGSYITLDGLFFDTQTVTAMPIGPQGLVGPIGLTGPIGTVQDEGIVRAARSALNFVGAAVAATDDAANNRTNVTVNALGIAQAGLRLVRGMVAANGTINFGEGFTINNWTTGGYVITFNPAFGSTPVVVGTSLAGASGIGIFSIDGAVTYNNTQIGIRTINNDTYANLAFTFFAIGV